MEQPLVSIITPAYNAAGVVNETIQSVLQQTHSNWELLIADDCSKDNTREVLQEWALRDARIKFIPLAKNGGPANARNAALEQAQGTWLAFLDSDDLWLPEKLARCLQFAAQHDAPFVFTGFRRISADAKTTGRYISVPTQLNYKQLLGNTAIATSTVMLNKTRVGTVHMQRTYYDDFACWLEILKRGHIAYGLNEDLMRYRVLNKSVSRNKRRSALHVWRAYRTIEKLNPLSSAWYFGQYALRGALKYFNF